MSNQAIVGNLQARLGADISEFTANLKASAIEAEGFSEKLTAAGVKFSEAGVRLGAVNRLVTEFQGTLDKRKAEEYAVAIGKIGDASMLTEADQRKVNAVMVDAIGHYKAIGQEAPDHFKKIAAETAKVVPPTDTLMGSVSKLAGAFGLAFTGTAIIAGIKNLIGDVLETASAIHDQSSALGFSTEAFQRNVFAAEQSGGSLEKFSKAASILNDNLAGGSNSTVQALTRAGLKFEEIRAMKPEEAWAAVTNAVGKIEDPMMRANVAQDLFGKGGRDLLPGMIEGYTKLGEAATVMSDATIERLEAAQDAWDALGKKVTIWTGTMIAAMLKYAKDGNQALIESQDEATAAVNRFIATVPKQTKALSDGIPKVKSAADALAEYEKVNKDSEAQLRKNIPAQEAHTKSIQALADTFTGKAIAQKALDLAEALKSQGGASKLTAEQTHLLFLQIDALVKGPLGSSALPKSLKDVWLANADLTDGINTGVTPAFKAFLDHLNKLDLKLPVLESGIKTFMANTKTNVVGGWKEQQKAGEDAWEAQEKAAADALKAIEQRHAQFVGAVENAGVALIDGMIHGWDSFKAAAKSILDDIVNYLEHFFVRKVMEYFGVIETGGTSAFAGIASSATSTATTSTVAAGTTSAGWAAAFSSMAASAVYTAGIALLAWGAVHFISSHFGQTTPTQPTPPGPEPGSPDNPNPGGPGSGTGFDAELAYAQQLYDQGVQVGNMQTFLSYLYMHPYLTGFGQGFSEGTRGQFVDFGAGTLAMLHGRERIVTEEEANRFSALRMPYMPDASQFMGAAEVPMPTGAAEAMASLPPIINRIYLNGRMLGESVTPEMAKFARRKGLTKA